MVVSHEFDKEINIIVLSDLHIGASKFDENLLFSIPKRYPNYYYILAGDYIDATLKTSIGDIYESQFMPAEQVQIFMDFLSMIKGKVLGAVAGNHDYRIAKEVGIDIFKTFIFPQFNIPYNETYLIIDININGLSVGSKKRINYAIAVHHGAAGGRYPEKSVREGRWFKEVYEDIDIFVSGHTHSPTTFAVNTKRYDRKNKYIRDRTIHFAIGGSLVQSDKYAERKLLPPVPVVFPIIELKKMYPKKVKIYLENFIWEG